MTLSCSRKATIRSYAVALVDDDLAGLALLGRLDRDDLLARSAAARPGPPSTPRSATVSWSTGLPLAAMMPLKDG